MGWLVQVRPVKIIYFIWAKSLVRMGCSTFLEHIWDVSTECPSIKLVPIVLEFQGLFSIDFLSMSSDRDTDFALIWRKTLANFYSYLTNGSS